jgi:hypothetical protein
MSSATPHRIDPPSFPVPHLEGGSRPTAPRGQAGSLQADESASAPDNHPPPSNHSRAAPAEISPASDFQRLDGSHRIPSDGGSGETPHPDEWLQIHAAELIDRLQHWASDLDARESQLNARFAVQDHRERQFRMKQQDIAAEMCEQQRAIERFHREIQIRAERLVIPD